MAPPAPPSEENFWHLPSTVREIYRDRKITGFYDWQKVCLNHSEVLSVRRVLAVRCLSLSSGVGSESHLFSSHKRRKDAGG